MTINSSGNGDRSKDPKLGDAIQTATIQPPKRRRGFCRSAPSSRPR